MKTHHVLTKPGRILVLIQPKDKHLRKRAKRGWHLFGTGTAEELDGMLKEALLRDETADKKPARRAQLSSQRNRAND
jgi:hypothetical protein